MTRPANCGIGTKPTTRVEALLWDLCATYGRCLPSEQQAALLVDPPQTADAFVDAVLRAEGDDPATYDRHARADLTAVVADWLFDDGTGKGTRSGLP
jgi:hypothetical protein